MGIVLIIIALLLGVYGLMEVLSGRVIKGFLFIILAFLVGPGGYSLFT